MTVPQDSLQYVAGIWNITCFPEATKPAGKSMALESGSGWNEGLATKQLVALTDIFTTGIIEPLHLGSYEN